jgi:6-phosphogluconate dehydrogenase
MKGGISMEDQKYDIGMVGLGVMGRNLVLNMADHGFSVVGLDKNVEQVQALEKEAAGKNVRGVGDIKTFIKYLKKPRSAMMLVPAGPPVDSVIQELLPHLDPGDLIIDGGNSHFTDTDVRAKALQERDILYIGMGISGGEHGARFGPSMMPGGPKSAYDRVESILEAASAKVGEEPCVTYLGSGSAGHYVKMVHNGIEYGVMQLIAESYDIMRRGLELSDEKMGEIFKEWNESELRGYLMEITGNIFRETDAETGKNLIDVILDEAKQKGTGMWTSQDAMQIQVPLMSIDVAVGMRNLSALKDERKTASHKFRGPDPAFKGDQVTLISHLRNALYAAMVLTYAQGMNQLYVAAHEYEYGYQLEDVARIWRGGCIIRADLLENILSAYQKKPDLPNLLLDENLGRIVDDRQEDLREIVQVAAGLGIPAPGFMASLAYFDGYRSEWLPANLIQAQRDYFGAHTYERADEKGVFHTQWAEA